MSRMSKTAAKEKEASSAHEPSVENRRARFEFEFLERFEAGVVLTGTEIKSIRTGRISLDQAYARIKEHELWLMGLHVPPYKEGSFSNHEPTRPRKLLLHREQLESLEDRVAEKGLTLIPVRLYFKRGRVKIDIALARGKKLWDKRRDMKERDVKRELARAVKK